MWEISNSPTRSRTAACSSRIPEYCTGISQPPNGTIFAPHSRCAAYKGVRLRVSALCMARYVNGGVGGCQFRNKRRNGPAGGHEEKLVFGKRTRIAPSVVFAIT